MKILAVLRTLMLTPVGLLLTNEGVCEILQSTFRICFETRLSDLLRKTAELALNDMIQLLFTRLPSFSEESLPLLKKLKMRNSGHNDGKTKRKKTKDKAAEKKKILAKKDLSPAPNSKLNTSIQDSPSSVTSDVSSPTQTFNVDSDVLARSPTGSIADLTQIQSDTESEKPQDDVDAAAKAIESVKLTVTSPKGTETVVAETATTKDVTVVEPEGEDESSKVKEEFVNAQV